MSAYIAGVTVIRLDGTNAEEGRQILLDAGIAADKLQSEPTMLGGTATNDAVAPVADGAQRRPREPPQSIS